ncbi:unnamed protein product [Linum trigynum]|uniref:Uncharacterized protein n=1 Tax=Linum trigynum TaxID=586398 RepID=A0AAV2CFM7_9ROSI
MVWEILPSQREIQTAGKMGDPSGELHSCESLSGDKIFWVSLSHSIMWSWWTRRWWWWRRTGGIRTWMG